MHFVCVCGGGGGGNCFKNRKVHSEFSKKSDLFYQLKAHTHILYIYSCHISLTVILM